MSGVRQLIVNADDFGQSHGVNRGIFKAHENGIVTSASLMVRWPAAAEAVAYAQRNPLLSLGLHLDLGELIYRDGEWKTLYTVVSTKDARAVESEIHNQLDTFRKMAGHPPTHVDSHQQVHDREPVRSILARIARELGIPVRGSSVARYRGDFYGQNDRGYPCHEAITVDAMLRILEALPPGVTELSCHPASGCDLDTMYLHEREKELQVLCDPRVQAAIASGQIVLCSFHQMA